MWIRDQDGFLINLAHVIHISYQEKTATMGRVKAHFPTGDLNLFTGSIKAACDYVEWLEKLVEAKNYKP
jgi:hypothetical protein